MTNESTIFKINETGQGNLLISQPSKKGESRLKYGLNIILPLDVDLGIIKVETPSLIIRNKEELERLGVMFSLGNKYSTFVEKEESYFTDLHSSLRNYSLEIIVPDNANVKEIFIEDHAEKEVAYDLIIKIGDNCNLNIIEKSNGNTKFRSQIVDLHIGSNSHVNYITFQNLGNSFNHSIKRGVCDKDSHLNWTDIHIGGVFVKTEITSLLSGEGSNTLHKSLFFGSGKQVLDMYARSIHDAPHTSSDMLTKGVVRGESKALYRGLVKIKAGAPHSEGYQKEDVLILDERAEANSIPELEIDNNEVKCTHGATVGNVNEEGIFYLMSRGLSREDAVRKIVEGFLFNVIDSISVEEVRNEVINTIGEKYDKVL